MAKRFLSLVLCMMLVVPTGILRAEETEITLFETILIGYVGGDDPMDDPELPGSIDPPTRFRASISQRILSVTSLVSAGAATIAVFDHHGELVCYEHRIFHSPNLPLIGTPVTTPFISVLSVIPIKDILRFTKLYGTRADVRVPYE